MRLIINSLVLWCLIGSGPSFAFQADVLIKNGNFDKWTNGKPDDWNVSVGAGRPTGKMSTIEMLDGGGVTLSGDRTTQRWQFLSQDLNLKSGKTYQLGFTAAVENIKLEGRQFDNCYVGVFTKNSGGKIVDQNFKVISSPQFQNETLLFEVSRDATHSVWIFLSKTGTLKVKSLQLSEVDPKSSFDVLVKDMDRNYSYFEHKKVNWKNLSDKYRRRATGAANKKAFTKVVLEMLGEINDGHIWIMENGNRLTAVAGEKRQKINYNIGFVRQQLKDVRLINKYCLTGRTKKGGFGYVLIDSLFQIDEKTFNRMCVDIHRLFNSPGLIVDCRTNGGGSEPVGQKIAGMFIDESLVYAKQKFRSGPDHSDFTEPTSRQLSPWRYKNDDNAFKKPIVCLQGPGAVSSGEGFVLMMKAIPHCVTIGLPTAGSTGNPAPIKLPNGVEVWYSRWVAMDAEGTVIEDVGIQPDKIVKHSSKNDSTFLKAIDILRKKTK